MEQLVFLKILCAADRLNRGLEEVLKPHGLSPTQYNVLRILQGSGEAGLACTKIGQHMICRDSDMTRLLDRMEKRKWVARQRQIDDRRVVRTRLTPTGAKMLASLEPQITELHRSQLGHLGPKSLETLATLLELP